MKDFLTKENIMRTVINTLICLVVWAVLDYVGSMIMHTNYVFTSSVTRDLGLAIVTGVMMTLAFNDSKKK